MMRALLSTLIVLGLWGADARASTFLLTGALDDGATPASGLFTFDLAILDAADAVLWQEQQVNVVVVDGAFAIDVGAVTALPGGLPGVSRLRVTINDDALPPFPLAALVQVDRAAVADVATAAATATRVGGVTAAEAVRASALAAAGGPTAPFSAVSGLPAGVGDGDQGTDVAAAGTGLTLGDRRLSVVNPVNADRFAAGAIDGGRFAAGSIPSTKVAPGAVTGSRVAADLTRANLAEGIGEAQVAGRVIFNVTSTGCAQQGLTTLSSCTTNFCDTGERNQFNLPIIGRRACTDNGSCLVTNPTTCANERIGILVAP